ncbi:hypothetical protein CTEN210_07877 [Chaetoceros tenuissimus]|uniref:Serine hydrolase domain-containing protein n=1 Tax=Chaetoceros tenuissimus TaxID=426638 RepID=A0AAD3CSI4_9STRA|nr:hypothetical protein CTEN210_07877 [Chaetoceros tenuissimus]
MKIRVLCLHDESSSAVRLINELKQLGERLHHKNKIELSFVNSPHILPQTSDLDEANEIDKDDLDRVWYYSGKDDAMKKIGLDASILHLRQIWSHSLYSNPFHGVLGIGQGATVAALLPLLRYEDLLSNDDNEQNNTKLMFEGLRFGIFINGKDILSEGQNTTKETDEAEREFVDACQISSLHIFNTSGNESESRKLYKRYGGDSADSNAEQSFTSGSRIDAKLMNILGKFLVKQKNSIVATTKTTFTNDKDIEGSKHANDALVELEKTKMELARIEEKALEVVSEEIRKNPPKALMAMIMPDGKRGGTLVGGYVGDRDAFRSEEFVQSGGAPCPEEFKLPTQDRVENNQINQ